jgi:asparagine synthase (glutamine-hydrolysing)
MLSPYMCGIAGFVTRDGSRPDEGLIRRASGCLAHRGPDGEGIWVADGVGLAHRRLAIIDLDTRANQPMHDASGRFTIVFNGEIYNYKELRAELNVAWKTQSDTEVILEGFRVWGDDVVTKLRGMFALAIWDAEKKRLFIARDRIGKKPLYFAHTPQDGLVFASEIKAFQGIVDLKADWNDVRTFLGLQYVPTPRTGFVGVSQLAPGHVGIFENGSFTTNPYHMWSRETCEMSEDHIDTKIRELLEESVKIRQLAADVPVGAFLSGGVDSAAVVAYATKYAQGPFHTFTMGFPSADMDERSEARDLATHFKTEHHEFEARPEDLLSLVDDIVTQYDAPYADPSALPLWLLAKETSKQIKVVLTGDGGDELFGGYKRYVAYQRAQMLASVPFTDNVAGIVGRFDPKLARFADVVRALRNDSRAAYGEMFCGSYFNSSLLHSVFKEDFLKQTEQHDAVTHVARAMNNGSSLADAMFFDLTSYLADDLNVKMDRATMRFGLEARAPFLDQELVQFALGLSIDQKVKGGKTKIALKRALGSVLPADVLNRKKRGFQVPLAVWFRGPLKKMVEERCLDPHGPLAKIVRLEEVRRLIDENARGRDHGNRLWMLLVLSSWVSRYGI